MADKSNSNKQQRRSAERKRHHARHRKPWGRYVTATLVIAVALLVAGVLIFRHFSQEPQQPQMSGTTTLPPQTSQPPSTAPTQPDTPTTQIQLVFGGDLVINDAVVSAGMKDGRIDYTDLFMDIAPVLASANAAGINFEGNTYGMPYGTATSSAPSELMKALANAGVDLVQVSNTCTVKNGILGLGATLQEIRAAGMTSVGGYSERQQAEAEEGYTICDIGGIRVAIIGYTKGFDGLSLPPSGQWCTNLLYTDYATSYQKVAEKEIKATLKKIEAQKPDLTVALLHWGSTYNDIISASQKKIEKIMLENGVDAIIGTHPHYVQQVKYDETAGTVVAYSLGDLFSAGEQSGSNYSILLQLQVTRDNLTGETKITGCDYVPIYTLTPQRDGEPMRVVRIEEAMKQYESSHIHRVNATAYQNMKNALDRIRSRVGF
jgi:poly-gamma-glutamate synthesis protein (capsule biosynthesis protein)